METHDHDTNQEPLAATDTTDGETERAPSDKPADAHDGETERLVSDTLIEPEQTQAPVVMKTAPVLDRETRWKRLRFRLTVGYIVVAILTLGVSAYITYREPDFLPIAFVAGSIAALILFFTVPRRAVRPSLITVGVALLVAGGAYVWFEVINGNGGKSKIAVRVADLQGKAVARTSVFLLYGGEIPIKQSTDSAGTAIFSADESYGDGRLVAEANGFQVYEEAINLSHNRSISLNLHPLGENERSVIVRVVKKEQLQPINGAKVILITGGNTYEDLTDQNGLAKFKIAFSSDTLDADLTVEGGDNSISNQSVSLRPDQLQEVRLDPINKQANIAPIQAVERADTPLRGTLGFNPADVLPTTLFDKTAPSAEKEPNDALGSAQVLDTFGADHPVTGEINAFSDNDYYVIKAKAGNSYAIELFDVDGKLGLSTNTYSCFGKYDTFKGLALAVYDPGENPVATQCYQNRGSNVFSGLTLQAKVDGNYVIQVAPHSEKVSGSYKLRVLPKYGEAGASWDRISFEPNNAEINAFPIKPGYANALTSAIDPQPSALIAELADDDWYQFNASAGKTYVIELFNVEDLLGLGSATYTCLGRYDTYSGIGMDVLNTNLDQVATSCTPNGAANVHTTAQFTAQVNGIHYIHVFSHVAKNSGIYSVRVLPQHDQGGSNDPATLEPNNRRPNATQLTLDTEANSLFEERPAGYSTNAADTDWYYFRAEAGTTYVIEVLNVADTLILGNNTYSCYDQYGTFSGVALGVFDATNERVAAQCAPTKEGAVHTKVEIESLVNNNYYIDVTPHFGQGYGEYSIRVRKK